MDRLEAPEHLAQVVAAVLQALAGAGDEQLQVRPRVGVERGVDLVGVDVRQRVRDRDRAAVRHRLAVARVHLHEHVLQRRLRPQQRGRVLRGSGSSYSRLDLERDDRDAVLELHVRRCARPRRPPRARSGPDPAARPARSRARARSASASPRRAGSGSPAGSAGRPRSPTPRIARPRIARKSIQCFLMASFTARLRRASRRRPGRSGSADPGSRTARPAGAAAACSGRAAPPARSCPAPG